ncbi:DUF5615 family PIN-like protein [Nitrosopumilus sp.]|uniref:DUF5615 family PIN-like protein n=1 Tax=Nitrosopumilus sp. TaxID=2024843 RepID=UPI0034A04FE5
MKILVDEMYDGLDEKLIEAGYFEVQSVKKLINSGKKLQSDFSVLNYARDNEMILITADVENKKGCEENNMPCVAIGKINVFDFVKNELEKLEKGIPLESSDGSTDDEVLDAFNKIKSGEASRMGQKGSS